MGPSPPRISVIMAAYNAGRTIDDAIGSVLAQTFSDWELIVIDDCSADETAAIATAYAERDRRVRVLKNETNLGVSETRRRALQVARGEWIAVLDSDDLWLPEKLEKQLALARRTGAALVFTGSAFIAADGAPIDWVLHVPETVTYRALLKQNVISNSSVLVRTELYREHYVTGDALHEDFAVWLGITKAGKTAYGLDEPLLVYRVAPGSRSGNKLRSARMNWNTYRRVGLDPVAAAWYMGWYTVRGVMKYRHLKP